MVIKNKIIKHLVDVIGTSSAASTKAENLSYQLYFFESVGKKW